jgi:Papain family cysteine protease/Cathepsin propeptide inhibitor domain (I29)
MEFREDRRRKAFEDNLEKIRKHNEAYKNGTYSFKLSPNNLADLTNQQYLRHYVRLINSQIDEENDQDYVLGNEFDDNAYPPTLDWREKGFVTKPSNQKSCGSCYAFSIAHSVEGQLFKKLGKIIELRSVGSAGRSRKIDLTLCFRPAHSKSSTAVLTSETMAVLVAHFGPRSGTWSLAVD